LYKHLTLEDHNSLRLYELYHIFVTFKVISSLKLHYFHTFFAFYIQINEQNSQL